MFYTFFIGLYTSKPTESSTDSAVDENNKISNNGVISGPGTGSIPVDESSSGSYLGLKIPGDSSMSEKITW